MTDVSGEAFYIRDELTGKFWSPTPLPARGQSPYVARHGFGYSIFEHAEDGVSSELCIYVAVHEPVKFAVFKLKNNSDRRRRLSVTGYWEWVLGELRARNAMHIVTEIDQQTGALLARNPYNTDFEGRVAFVAGSELARSVTGDRLEFSGETGLSRDRRHWAGHGFPAKPGAGFDPCAAMQMQVELEPGQEREISFILGAGQNLEQSRDLVRRFQNLQTCRDELQRVRDFWKDTLGAVQVETSEPALNIMVNGWLLYQVISCRLWARTAFINPAVHLASATSFRIRWPSFIRDANCSGSNSCARRRINSAKVTCNIGGIHRRAGACAPIFPMITCGCLTRLAAMWKSWGIPACLTAKFLFWKAARCDRNRSRIMICRAAAMNPARFMNTASARSKMAEVRRAWTTLDGLRRLE